MPEVNYEEWEKIRSAWSDLRGGLLKDIGFPTYKVAKWDSAAIDWVEVETEKGKEMKIEVGKAYRNRNGETVHIVEFFKYEDFPFHGDSGKTFTENGFYYGEASPNTNDLIELVEKPEIKLRVGQAYITEAGKTVVIAEHIPTATSFPYRVHDKNGNDHYGYTEEGKSSLVGPDDRNIVAVATGNDLTTTEEEKMAKSTPNYKKSANPIGDAVTAAIQESLRELVKEDNVAKIIRDEIAKMPPYNVNILVNHEPIREIEGYVRPEFEEVLHRAMHRLNILMVGPAGCGKTHLASQVANALGMRFASISCSAGMSESQLTGWLIPTGEGGQFEYVQSVFVDIYENGGVFLLDEFDAADGNTLLFVNQALANGEFFLPQRYKNPHIKKHPDCVIMAAANTYGTGGNMIYAGREKLDESTLDRFRAGVVEVKYDERLEEILSEEEIRHWGQTVRKKISETKLNRVMSTRFMIDASKLKRSGAPLSKIKEIYFHGWREDERKKVAA